MTSKETATLIKDVLKKLWPTNKWNPSSVEMGIWQDMLSPFTFEVAKEAVGLHFAKDRYNQAQARQSR
jgi:hypothetical protein